MSNIIGLILGNFPLFCLILAFLVALVQRKKMSFSEALTRYLLLLPIGMAGLWGFYFHAFQPEKTAKMIGWATSPFQFEVAVANLGLGLIGVVGFWKTREFALAVVLMGSGFLWGAAVGHIQQMIEQANYAPGNTGSILITDILIPCFLWLGFLFWKKSK